MQDPSFCGKCGKLIAWGGLSEDASATMCLTCTADIPNIRSRFGSTMDRGIGAKVSDTWGGIKEVTAGFFGKFRKAPLPIVATTSPAADSLSRNLTTPFNSVGESARDLHFVPAWLLMINTA